MAILAPARQRVTPAYVEPGILIDQAQSSGAFAVLPDGTFKPRLGLADQRVYMNRMGIKTKSTISQDSQNEIPDPDIILGQLECPTYLLQNRAIYNRHETAAAATYGLSTPEILRIALFQANFNQMRDGLLHGIQPEYGEGILNGPNILNTALPADKNGNIGIREQDAGEIATFLLNVIADITARTNQSGRANEFTILGPQRCLKKLETAKIVELTSYQRPGGGTHTVKGTVNKILEDSGEKIFWTYDDTLQNKGTNGADAIIVCLRQFNTKNPFFTPANTNYFGEGNGGLQPINDCSAMYTDATAPVLFITPLPGTSMHMQSEMKITPGWVLRPEAFTIISAFAEAPEKPSDNNNTSNGGGGTKSSEPDPNTKLSEPDPKNTKK